MGFKHKYYWTGNIQEDAERINRPHIKAQGENENRIGETISLIQFLDGQAEFTLADMLNIQNQFLITNNWAGIKPGFREHNVTFAKFKPGQTPEPNDTPDHSVVPARIAKLFPVKKFADKESALKWYSDVMQVHPLSDLNGRTIGVIMAVLNRLK